MVDQGGNRFNDMYASLKIAAAPVPFATTGGATVGVLPVYIGSPLIGAGDPSQNATTDERGVTRPADPSQTNPTIGAFDRSAGPDAVASAANVTVGGGNLYTLTVTYSDSAAINTGTLASSNLTITTPTGVPAVTNLHYVSVNASNPESDVATYTFTPPAGTWVGSDNGFYSVNVVGGQVTSANGSAAAGSAGTFAVLVRQTFTVTTTTDTGTGLNGVGSNGGGDLRYCIAQANLDTAVGAPDIIAFSNNTNNGNTNFYDGSVHTITLNSALPWITDPVTINGPTLTGSGSPTTVYPGGGVPAVTITRNTGVGAVAMRIFSTNPNAIGLAGTPTVVTLNNLTLSGASGSSLPGTGVNVVFGNLTLNNMLIQNNTGTNGAGVAVSALAAYPSNNGVTPTITITNSTIQANTGAAGAGIYDSTAGSTLAVTNSAIQNNKASSNGGGIDPSAVVYTTLTNDTITGNSASGNGGGIYAATAFNSSLPSPYASFTVTNSTIANNTGSQGGGIFDGGNLNITTSTISGNTATAGNVIGTTAGANGGGGLYLTSTSATTPTLSLSVTNSTIANNLALNGGGINANNLQSGTQLVLTSDTISGNTAINANSVPGQGGGGIALPAQVLTGKATSGSIALDNTIVSNNFAVNGRNDISAVGAISPSATVYVQANYSAIGSTNGYSLSTSPASAHNLIGFNLDLGSLSNNGGSTLTVPLLANSPALGVGDPALNGQTDQIGTSRPQGMGPMAQPDIGALERITGTASASATVSNVTASANLYQVTVTYASDTAINTGSIAATNVTITPPSGVTVPVVSVASINSTNPNAVVVTYQFTPTGAGGVWTQPTNGTYTVNMLANQVKDSNSNFVPAGALASFFVAVPTTFTVTATTDTGTGSNGSGDLRYCITQANLISPSPAIIVFSNSTAGGATNFYDGAQHTISLGTTALPSFNTNLTIVGPGASVLTITRPTAASFQLFPVIPLAANAFRLTDTFSGFTLSGVQSSALGAAVEDSNGVALTLNNVTIQNNSSSTSGAGIYNNTGGDSITLNNCLIQNNTSATIGAGIDMGTYGVLTINNSTINANTANGNGSGGVWLVGTGNFLNVVNSTVSNNLAPAAGSAQSVGGFGAGIGVSNAATNFTSVLIDHSTIAGNSSSSYIGGGGFAFEGSVGPGGVTIQDSTIANNTAVNGGGIILGGPAATGSGVFLAGNVNIVSSTITGNSATNASAPGGGGICFYTSTTTATGANSTLNLDSTIVSGNNSTAGNDDIFETSSSTATVQATYSALGTSAGYTLGGSTANNLPFGSALNLQTLGNNGGPTQTEALGTGSLAIDAGDPVTTLTTDQRGYARTFGAAPDIGAFEYQPPTVTSVVVSDGITGDGTTQRSEVREITVTFSTAVNFTGGNANAAAAFQLQHVQDTTNVANLQAAVSTNASNQTVVTLTFTTTGNSSSEVDPVSILGNANAVPGPSLADGRFQLTIFAANVNGLDGQSLAGGGAGGNYVSPTDTQGGGPGQLQLYRLFGDATGNGIVDALDLGQFRTTYNAGVGNPMYRAYLDADNSGFVDSQDLGQFRTRYNGTVFN